MKYQSKRNEPKVHRVMDMYKVYAQKLLADNPEYWSKYNYSLKISNYTIFRKENSKVLEVMSYPLFKKILQVYFTQAKEIIIMGGEVNLGNQLGCIAPRRVERNFKNKQVNFAATAKQPKDDKGKPTKIIYYMEEDWCRIGWSKGGGVKNIMFYKFEPTPGDMRGGGFKYEFSQALIQNPLLKYKYKYYPFIVDKNDLQLSLH
jgi:hypothetical protein